MAKSAELLVDPGLDGVRAARHLAAVTLERLPDGLAADAEVIVAELVTNALLHGMPPIRLRLDGRRHRVRIEVSDTGRAVPMRGRPSSDAMTGRGLSVVESLATSWGVEPSSHGKLVWAELGRPSHRWLTRWGPSANELQARLELWRTGGPDIRYEVRLGWAPTELLLAAKAHIDNIVRELALMPTTATEGPRLPEDVVAMLIRATADFAEARTEIKRQALEAASLGNPYTDLRLRLPVSAAAAGLRYLTAIDEADRWARASRLLTVAAPPSHRVFREWYVRALVDHLHAVAGHRAAPPLRPFALELSEAFDEANRS